MIRTTTQNKRLHQLLCKLHIDLDTKEQLVKQYTRGRTHRSSEMNMHECQALINRLSHEVTPTQEEMVLDRQRKRVISHMAQAGYVLPTGQPDMAAINAWVKQQKFKKKFNDHTSRELSVLIHASRQVLNHLLSKS